MNRQQRRKAQKQIPKYRRGMTHEDRVKALMKNGISPEDLEKAYHDGWKAGWLEGGQNTLKACYAAFICSLKQHYRFGRVRCKRALVTADELVMTTLGHDEMIERAWKEVGLQLNFDAPFERVEEAGA